jgi:melibiose permease/lactose/raffinose/galactose permease
MVALAICIISPLFASFTLFGVKENRSDMAIPPTKISIRMIIKTIVSNDQLLWISLVFLIQQVGNGIVLAGRLDIHLL